MAAIPSFGPGVHATRFGLLTANTVNGNVPRDIGTMPGPLHLGMNLSRVYAEPEGQGSPTHIHLQRAQR